MIALALLAAATLGLGELPPQPMPPGKCLTFLWSKTEPPLRFAMIDEAGGFVRVVLNGRPLDAPRTAPGTYALPDGTTLYVDIILVTRAGLVDGNIVESGSVRLEAPGKDATIVPVGGIRGCS